MLGEAPGTARLGEWVASVDDGMTLEELANHIAASDAFQATYPNFSTNQEFAEAFLGNLMGGEEVSAELMSAAVTIVVGLLNDGMTRGALALAAVNALLDIAMDENHPARGDLGGVAVGLYHRIDVAKHYTLEARMADPSSDALAGVTSDPDTAMAAKDAIDNPPTAPEDMTGDNFSLAKTRDNIKGTDYDDNFLADADEDGFATLNGFDTIDGGDGNDIMSVFDISTDPDIGKAEYDAQVSNIERLEIFARGGIDANLSGWEGLEHVELEQFSRSGNVKITVDGATVGTDRTFGGDVTIVGAAGEVSVMAGKTSVVKVGSGAHTTSVMTKGGMTVDVNGNGAMSSAASQSDKVTTVVIDGVAGEGLGGDGKRGISMEADDVTVSATNASAVTPSESVDQYGTNENGTFTPIPDAATNPTTKYYKAANQDINGDTAGTGLTAGQVVVTTVKADAAQRAQVFKDGKRVDPGTEGAVNGTDSGEVPIHVNSDAIEHVSLSNTYATIAVVNKSKEAEDLTVTVNKYGSAAVAGKFCITGDGAAENVSIMVAGDSNFALANNATKTVSIDGEGDLTLEVTDFVGPPTNVNAGGANTPKASTTLESITSSGSGKLTMDVAGTTKLKTIDGSASSGGSSIKGVHDAVTMVDGGSGNDAITVAGFHKDGLMVNLGAGNDTFSSAGGNDKSRVDGGDGTDVLHLTGNSATHKVDGKDVSIFSNFEALEIGGSGEAAHDVGLLGVQTVSARASTGSVTLNNMADGMGIDVIGKAGATMVGTHAMITHSMKAREAGDRRYSGELDVSLHASGGAKDTKVNETGTAKLTLTADGEVEILNVASSASVGGSHASVAAKDKPSAASYKNELILMGASDGDGNAAASNVEAIIVSGDAMAMISVASGGTGADATQFAELELIEAVDNTGGVIFSAVILDGDNDDTNNPVLAQKLEMVGGSGADTFTGGGGGDELEGNGGKDTLNGGGGIDTITGGAGADTLTGGADNDVFKYASASESQMGGYDTVTDWASGDTFSLGKTVFNGLHRGENIREVAAAEGINSTDAADDTTARTDNNPTTNPSANSLKDWLGDGKDVFKTSTGTGLATEVTQHAITTVVDTYHMKTDQSPNVDTDEDGENDSVVATRTWVLIDVDADGDFDADTDMVILLSGTQDLADTGSDFTA